MSEQTPNPTPDPPQPRSDHHAGTPHPSRHSEKPIVVVQQPGIFRTGLRWLGLIVAGLCLMSLMGLYTTNMEYFDQTGGIREKYHSLSKKHGDNKIAVLNASGVIMSGDGFVKQQIDKIREDKNVKAIVLRIDSPGGTVYGSDYLYHHLVKLREERELPMVVSMGSLAASGGYYIAMAVGDQDDCIFAEPMTTTGSIGVIIPHYNISGMLQKLEVVDDSIATHERKDMLSITKPMTDDDREVIGKYIGHAFDRFKEVIKSGRPRFAKDAAALDELATGEVFTSKQAKASGLIDEVGFVEDAIQRAIELAGLNSATTRVVTYEKPITLADAFALGKTSPQNMVSDLIDLSMPRAYYLATPLPSAWSKTTLMSR